MAPPWSRDYSLRLLQMDVLAHQEAGSIFVAAGDEPYVVPIGFRSRLATPGSTRVFWPGKLAHIGKNLVSGTFNIPQDSSALDFYDVEMVDMPSILRGKQPEIFGALILCFESDGSPWSLIRSVIQRVVNLTASVLQKLVENRSVLNPPTAEEVEKAAKGVVESFSPGLAQKIGAWLGSWSDPDDYLGHHLLVFAGVDGSVPVANGDLKIKVIDHTFAADGAKYKVRGAISGGWNRLPSGEVLRREGSPVVTAWGPDHLDVITTFNDGTVRNKAWDASTGKWWPGQTEWANLGGQCIGSPAICAWGPGHLDLVATFKDGIVRNKAWDASTGKWWPGQTEWANLGGQCIGSPAICAWAPGHLDLVATFKDGSVRNKAWDASTGKWWPGQTEWANLGGQSIGTPAICAWAPGHLDLVATFKDGTVRNKAWNRDPGTWWPGQTEWANLGGESSAPPAICHWGPGHLDVIATFKDGTVRYKAWDKAHLAWWPGQTAWIDLGGDVVGAPSICAPTPRELRILARFKDGTIRYKELRSTGDWWPGQTGWKNLGGSGNGPFDICARHLTSLDVVAHLQDGIGNKVWNPFNWWPSETGWAKID